MKDVPEMLVANGQQSKGREEKEGQGEGSKEVASFACSAGAIAADLPLVFISFRTG